jgi:hypothetical protein
MEPLGQPQTVEAFLNSVKGAAIKMAKQMIDFQKATFDNTFDAIVLLQEQTERMADTFMEQATSNMEQSTFLPEEGKKMLREWVQASKKGLKEFKKAMDECFGKVEDYLINRTDAE